MIEPPTNEAIMPSEATTSAPEQQLSVISLPPVPAGHTRLFIDLPADNVHGMIALAQAIKSPSPADLIDRAMGLFFDLYNRANMGDTRVFVEWNRGRPGPTILQPAYPRVVVARE